MASFSKYVTVYKTTIKDQFQYRFNLIAGWVLSLYTFVIPFTLWTAIFSNQDSYYNYEFSDMMMYIVLITLLGPLVIANGVHRKVAGNIYSGELNKYLFKPIDFRIYNFTSNIALKSFQFLIKAIFILLIFLLIRITGYFDVNFDGARFFLLLPSLILGTVLSYLIYYSLGLIAFWLIQCDSLFWVIESILALLTGMLFPIDILPRLSLVSKFLPFQYVIFFPVQIFVGVISEKQILYGYSIQILWLIVLFIISNTLWKLGIKRYTAIGG